MSRTGDWSLNPLVCGAHSQMATPFACISQLPPKFEQFGRILANQMRAVPANFELTRSVPANYVHSHVQIRRRPQY